MARGAEARLEVLPDDRTREAQKQSEKGADHGVQPDLGLGVPRWRTRFGQQRDVGVIDLARQAVRRQALLGHVIRALRALDVLLQHIELVALRGHRQHLRLLDVELGVQLLLPLQVDLVGGVDVPHHLLGFGRNLPFQAPHFGNRALMFRVVVSYANRNVAQVCLGVRQFSAQPLDDRALHDIRCRALQAGRLLGACAGIEALRLSQGELVGQLIQAGQLGIVSFAGIEYSVLQLVMRQSRLGFLEVLAQLLCTRVEECNIALCVLRTQLDLGSDESLDEAVGCLGGKLRRSGSVAELHHAALAGGPDLQMFAQPLREVFLRGQFAARVLTPEGKSVLVLRELQIRDHFVDHAIAEDHVGQGRHEHLRLLRIGRAKRTGDWFGRIDVGQDLRGRHVFSRHQQAADQCGRRR